MADFISQTETANQHVAGNQMSWLEGKFQMLMNNFTAVESRLGNLETTVSELVEKIDQLANRDTQTTQRLIVPDRFDRVRIVFTRP
jgi:hypothetical protein